MNSQRSLKGTECKLQSRRLAGPSRATFRSGHPLGHYDSQVRSWGDNVRIGYFVPHYPHPDEPPGYFWGGSGEAAAGLAEAMAELGHDIVVFASSPDSRSRIRRWNGVTIVECSTWLTLSQAKIAPSVMYRGLAFDFDIVHAHVASPPADFGALVYACLNNVPLVITYHGDPQSNYGSAIRRMTVGAYRRLALRRLLSRADLLYVPSLPFAQESRVLRTLGRAVKELPNGVRRNAFNTGLTKREAREILGLPSDAGVALYLGSLSPYKGPDVLVEAANSIKRKSGDIKVVIVGDGMMRDTLAERTRTLRLASIVRLEGHISETKKPTYLAAADVLVLPSTMTQEVFPIAILEAFAVGLPVVVSDLKTFERLVVNGVNGLVVPRGDSQALADVLLAMLSDTELRYRLGSNARQYAERYDWRRIAQEAEADYLRMTETDARVQTRGPECP